MENDAVSAEVPTMAADELENRANAFADKMIMDMSGADLEESTITRESLTSAFKDQFYKFMVSRYEIVAPRGQSFDL